MTNIEIGKRIKHARKIREATLDEVANVVGVAKSTIQRYEAGKIDKLKLPVIESIAKALVVNPAWLIGKSDIMEPTHDDHFFENLIDLGSIGLDRKKYISFMKYYTWAELNIVNLFLDSFQDLSESERHSHLRLLKLYLSLNDEVGKPEALKRLEELTKISEYTLPKRDFPLPNELKDLDALSCKVSSLLNAAHERTDIEVTDEMRKHDDDIMDDEEF